MFKYISFIISVFIIANLSVKSQVADFVIRDTVCVNQDILIQNTTIGGSSFYWNFCSGDLSITPSGINMGNIGALDRPVYSSIAKDGNNYFVFISNNTNGAITRLAFGNSLINTPVATNLGNFGVMGASEEGIEIKKDILTGNWFGLIVIGGYVDNIFRLNFGNSLNNIPTIENLGNVGNQMNYGHTIYTFYEGGDWYSFVGNYWGNTILRLDFGNSLGNIPKVLSLGNIGGLNGPVGFYPIQENGQWYLFVVNRDNSTLSRLDFGNSLLNFPTGINLGNIDGSFYFPRSISILRDCGTVYGFVVNQGSSDIIRLTFPDGLLSAPRGSSLGNIAGFSFPHHISELFRIGDSLFAFVMNVENNSISRLCFASCNNSSIPSSNLQNPPAFSYNSPGTYNVSLVVNEGLTNQSNMCKEIFVKNTTIPIVTGDTNLCIGNQLNLFASASPGNSYLWTGPNGFSASGQNLIIPNVDVNNAGKYTLTLSGCSDIAIDKIVSVAESPVITGDTAICEGEAINLISGSSPLNSYLWTGPDGFSSSSQNLIINNAAINNAGKYTLTINGCSAIAVQKFVTVVGIPIISGDTTICKGESLNLISSSSAGNSYLWTGPNGFTSSSQNLTIPDFDVNNSGKYSLTISGCSEIAVDKIVSVVESPIITGNTSVCTGDTLDLISGASLDNTVQWIGPNGLISTGINLTIPSVSSLHEGMYTLTIGGCSNISTSINISVKISPSVNLGIDTIICYGSTLILDAGNTGSTYQWANGANSQAITIDSPGSYSVKVFNEYCSASDDIIIEDCKSELWFPNVFSPNYDGLNERFKPVSLRAISSYQIIVFNRWGQQLYQSNDAYAGWDGTFNGNNCPDGVYYFVAEYMLGTQNSSVGQRVTRGAVTVLR